MVGILIPTKNRNPYLIRQLEYYAQVGCPHTIYIGEANEIETAAAFQKEIERFKGILKINYFHLPKTGILDTFIFLLSKVSEKYVCFCGDDDFQLPQALTKCAKFLDQNPEYGSAKGLAIHYSLTNPIPHEKLYSVENYPNHQIDSEKAVVRIDKYFDDYFCNLFSVTRKDIYEKGMLLAKASADNTFADELIPSTFTIVSAKSKQLGFLQFVREGFAADPKLKNILSRGISWVSKPNFAPSYLAFRKIMADEIVRLDKVSEPEANAAVDKAFTKYMQFAFRTSQDSYSKFNFKRILKQIPGIQALNKALRDRKASKLNCSESILEWVARFPEFGPLSRFITSKSF